LAGNFSIALYFYYIRDIKKSPINYQKCLIIFIPVYSQTGFVY